MADATPTVTKPYLSKTLIFNAIVACAALIPGVSTFVSAHTDGVLMGLGLINMALRMVTKDKIGFDS
jgi:hypothetical protein